VTLPLRPRRGGFLRPFGCGEFIRDFLWGEGLHGSPRIDPDTGSWQAEMFYQYKTGLIRAIAMDKATKEEERTALRENRPIEPDNITDLASRIMKLMPYRNWGARYHSFITYFSDLIRLGWVEESGKVEPSQFQEHYRPGQPRIYYRLTRAGKEADDHAWANPHRTLYGGS
jgi:hypothetical protein